MRERAQQRERAEEDDSDPELEARHKKEEKTTASVAQPTQSRISLEQ
jgi:hypothetical protein